LREESYGLSGVPTMYVAIINYPGVEDLDLSSIKWCASGGAPLPLEVQKRFQDISGCRWQRVGE
jgi:long-chain acyl-CoA synthetase